jgi:putative transposase
MPRRLRNAAGGFVYHVLNRAVGRATIFEDDEDYAAFGRAMDHAFASVPMRVLGHVLMPNHFHLVLWPKRDGELSEFMRRLTVTHTQRWHAHRHTAGTGPLYQGRFKSFPIQQDDHFLTVMRYVQRNPVRANLCRRAELWPWGSASLDRAKARPAWLTGPAHWPVPRPRDWTTWVNRPQTAAEEAALRQCIQRGRPLGTPDWTKRTAVALDLSSTLMPRGRPKAKR